jgi:hypothetical protein
MTSYSIETRSLLYECQAERTTVRTGYIPRFICVLIDSVSFAMTTGYASTYRQRQPTSAWRACPVLAVVQDGRIGARDRGGHRS